MAVGCGGGECSGCEQYRPGGKRLCRHALERVIGGNLARTLDELERLGVIDSWEPDGASINFGSKPVRCAEDEEDEPRSPWGRMQAACIAVADADSEDDAAPRRAKERVRRAAMAWLAGKPLQERKTPASKRESDRRYYQRVKAHEGWTWDTAGRRKRRGPKWDERVKGEE